MDIVERLSGYNPPDRTVDEQRQMAIDIQDAKAEIERLRDALQKIAGMNEYGSYQYIVANAALQQKGSK